MKIFFLMNALAFCRGVNNKEKVYNNDPWGLYHIFYAVFNSVL